jgi:GR25 family glycosyltransferase involved in LPS biosynthesis
MSFLNTIVDKVYVINLDKDKKRMENMHAQLTKYNIQYERFSAVQGSSVKNSPLLTAYCNSFCTEGMKGCAISHKTLWNRAVEKGYKSILILEDDAVLSDDFDTKLKNAWYQVPNEYDFVFLGCRLFCNTSEPIPIAVTNLLGHHPLDVDEHVQKIKAVVGLHGYIITSKAAKVVEDAPINWHIDMEIHSYIKQYNLNGYSIKPILIDVVDTGASNMSNSYPPMLNRLLSIRIFEQTTLAYALGEDYIKIGSFNINSLLIILFIITCFLPISTYKFIFLWIFLEGLISKDIHNTIKYLTMLSIPMVIRYSFKKRKILF